MNLNILHHNHFQEINPHTAKSKSNSVLEITTFKLHHKFSKAWRVQRYIEKQTIRNCISHINGAETYRDLQSWRDVTSDTRENKLHQLIAEIFHDVLVFTLGQSTLDMSFL